MKIDNIFAITVVVALTSLGIYSLLRFLCRQARYRRDFDKQCRNYIKRRRR